MTSSSPWPALIHALVAVFTIVNPIGAAGVFITLTEGLSQKEQTMIARRATIVCCLTLLAFMFMGDFILKLFSITLPAFKIAGGILVFTVALNMLYARQSPTKFTPQDHEAALATQDISIFPLGIPLMSGPAAITTVMILRNQAQTNMEISAVVLACVLTALATYLILSRAERGLRFLGETCVRVVTRLMGLLLAVIAVQFVLNGFHDIFPWIQGTVDQINSP